VCGNNLRTLYQALNSYQTEFDGYMMPERITPPGIGGQKNSYWFSPQLLGAQYGKNAAMAAIDSTVRDQGYYYLMNVVLQCPSNPPYPSDTTIVTPVGYSYNQNFGEQGSNNFLFRKFNAIPRETLVSLETHTGPDHGDLDYRFSSITDLFVFDYSKARGSSSLAGHPHFGGRAGNMLFADGQIVCDNPAKMDDPSHMLFNWIPNPFSNKKTGAFPF
jgi:prepilin-type processing-associated H-X9-DG protein